MKDFFFKHANSNFTPQDAIEMITKKVQKIRELVYQEDELHLEEMRLLSEMLDDYVREAHGYQFQKKDYQDMRGQYNPYQMHNAYEPPYKPGYYPPKEGGEMGYRHMYPIYPVYPFGANKPSGYPNPR